jgi:hypothetical protein
VVKRSVRRAASAHRAASPPKRCQRVRYAVVTGGDGIQPHGLFPVGAHLVSEGRGALSDAGFAAPDQQEVSHARLRVDRQGQELVVEKARVQLGRDGPPPAHERLETGLLSATVHQALTLAKRRCGVVDVLSCGRHEDLLSRP